MRFSLRCEDILVGHVGSRLRRHSFFGELNTLNGLFDLGIRMMRYLDERLSQRGRI
jgi:hypothetical protein